MKKKMKIPTEITIKKLLIQRETYINKEMYVDYEKYELVKYWTECALT